MTRSDTNNKTSVNPTAFVCVLSGIIGGLAGLLASIIYELSPISAIWGIFCGAFVGWFWCRRMKSCSYDPRSVKYFGYGMGLGVLAGIVATIFLHVGMACFYKGGFSDDRFPTALLIGLNTGVFAGLIVGIISAFRWRKALKSVDD